MKQNSTINQPFHYYSDYYYSIVSIKHDTCSDTSNINSSQLLHFYSTSIKDSIIRFSLNI